MVSDSTYGLFLNDQNSGSYFTNEIICNKLTTESNSWNIFTDHHHQNEGKEEKVTCLET